jgi:hypothetical protein
MSETKDKTIALNVRLKANEPSAHLRATNYTNLGVAQGIAYVYFGFIEPGCSPPLSKPQRMANPHRRDSTARSSRRIFSRYDGEDSSTRK